MKRLRFILAPLVAVALTAAAPAGPQEPTAVVTDVSQGLGVAFMDYVRAGQIISLGRKGRIVLGYLKSCVQETITGGSVTIGATGSEVRGGRVETDRDLGCDGGGLQLSAAQSAKAGAIIIRALSCSLRFPPSLILHGASPLIRVSGGGRVLILRLDAREESREMTVDGRFVDLAASEDSLTPGGIYCAQSGKRRIVFKIDDHAPAGPGPIISRLVPLK